jgi:fructose/tagatose bisphosphate aldolase
VGNAHGPYARTPNLDFERIRAIREAVSVPLVLHGSSDIPDGQMKEAVRQGISKFNVATEYFRAFYNVLESHVLRDRDDGKNKDAFALVRGAEEKVIAFLRAKMRLVRDV